MTAAPNICPGPIGCIWGRSRPKGWTPSVFRCPRTGPARAVALYIRHQDGTLTAPIALDSSGQVPVDRRFTGWRSGQWMLAATGPADYAAYTRPGSYDVGDTLSLEGATVPDPPPACTNNL